MPLIFLTEKDRRLLQEMLDELNRREIETPRQSDLGREDYQTSECYIAWPPEGGIPALTIEGDYGPSGNDQPGSAVCDIYWINESGTAELQVVTDFKKTVYNFSRIAVPQKWTAIHRTKYGRWIAPQEDYQASWIEFVINNGAGYDTTDEVWTVDDVVYHGGPPPDTAVTTVYNKPTNGDFMFRGEEDDEGKALYAQEMDPPRYIIIQLECASAGEDYGGSLLYEWLYQ